MAGAAVVAVVQAGGRGGRMDVLTRERAKPALPFAGVYRLVDFVLSSLSHNGITDVWLSVQYQAASLDPMWQGGAPGTWTAREVGSVGWFRRRALAAARSRGSPAATPTTS